MNTAARQTAPLSEALTGRSRQIRGVGGILLSLLAVVLVAMASAGVVWQTCLFHDLTGSSCLTCGMTRSFAAIGAGDLAGAFRYHLFGPVVLAVMMAVGIGSLAEALAGRRLLVAPLRRSAKTTVMLLGALWLVYGFVRMAVELCA